jgi:hypothetical protein
MACESELMELQEKENRIFEINEEISEFVTQWYEQNDLNLGDLLSQTQKDMLEHDLFFFTREKEMAILEFSMLLEKIG